MGFQDVKIARLIEITYQSAATWQFAVYTDLPGGRALRIAYIALPASSTVTVAKLRVPSTVKGRLWGFTLTPAAGFRLFGAKILAREVGLTAGGFTWRPLYAEPTADAWTDIKLPIEPTSDAWTDIPLPIEKTADGWTDIKLPIEPTADAWSDIKLPIEPTSDAWSDIKLPIEATSDEWTDIKLPIERTPDEYVWVDLPEDA